VEILAAARVEYKAFSIMVFAAFIVGLIIGTVAGMSSWLLAAAYLERHRQRLSICEAGADGESTPISSGDVCAAVPARSMSSLGSRRRRLAVVAPPHS
jgi:hypothetical protein